MSSRKVMKSLEAKIVACFKFVGEISHSRREKVKFAEMCGLLYDGLWRNVRNGIFNIHEAACICNHLARYFVVISIN